MQHLTVGSQLGNGLSGTIKTTLVTNLGGVVLNMAALADGQMLVTDPTTGILRFTNKPIRFFNITFANPTTLATLAASYTIHPTIQYTVVEAGNYLVKFLGTGHGDVNGNNVIYALLLNGVETLATRRQFGSTGSNATQINQIMATHFYYTNLVAGNTITLGFRSVTNGNITIEGRNLMVFKI
jgi:hypothetical protein